MSLYARNVEQVHMKDGSVFEGYVSKQIPGKTIMVHTVKSTRCINDSEIISISYYLKQASLISGFMNACDVENPDSLINVATIRTKTGQILSDAVVEESGVVIKVSTFGDKDVNLSWSDIVKMTKKSADANRKSGIRDVILLATTGERIIGQIIETHLLKRQYTIADTTGFFHVIKAKDIQTLRFEAIDKEKSIFLQSPLKDKIFLKDGTTVEGVIVSKQIGKTVTIISLHDAVQQTFSLGDVNCYEKALNLSYEEPEILQEKLKEEPVEELADVVIGGQESSFVPSYGDDPSYALSVIADSIKTVINHGENVNFNIKFNARTSGLCIVKTGSIKEHNFSISGLKIKSKGIDLWPKFSTRILADDVDVNFLRNENGRIEMDIIFSSAGIYIIYIKGHMDQCVPIKVD